MRIDSRCGDIGVKLNNLVNNCVLTKMHCPALCLSFRFLRQAIEGIMARSAMLISTTGGAVSFPNKRTEGTWRALSDDRLEVESVRGEGEERGEEENGERQIKLKR